MGRDRQEYARDPRPTSRLVDQVLGDPESDESGHALTVIHARGGAEEFEHGARLARATSEHERRVGAMILAQLGWGDRTHLEESVSVLLELLRDPSEDVVASGAVALGHRAHPRAIEPLIELSRHSNVQIRDAVVFGLTGQEDLRAVETLIRLTGDADRNVRDWATFALASQIDLDTLEIREALRARVDDEDPEIRGEALIGLARRRDPRALPLVQRELGREFHGSWSLEAAEHLGDPSLHPVLEALERRLDPENRARFACDLFDALAACRPKS